ncbi:hypothetical protein ACWDKQ_11820 [Saccharopolyspora sp. NPDC000995]
MFSHVTLPALRSSLIAGALFALTTPPDDLTVALFVVTTNNAGAAGADLQLPAVKLRSDGRQADGAVRGGVAAVVIERVVGVARLSGSEAQR